MRLIAVSALPILLGYVSWTLLLARGRARWLAGTAVTAALTGIVVSAVLVALHTDAAAAVAGTAVGATILAIGFLVGLRDLA